MPRKKKKVILKETGNVKIEEEVLARRTRSQKNDNKIQNSAKKAQRKGPKKVIAVKKSLRHLRHGEKLEIRNGFQCEICSLKFENDYALRGHNKVFGKLKYRCVTCHTKFSSKKQLHMHVEHAHAAVSIPGYSHRCNICNQVFRDKSLRHAHISHNHQRNRRPKISLPIPAEPAHEKSGQNQILKFDTKLVKKNDCSTPDDTCVESPGSMKSELEIVENKFGAHGVKTRGDRKPLEKFQNHEELEIDENKFEADASTHGDRKPLEKLENHVKLEIVENKFEVDGAETQRDWKPLEKLENHMDHDGNSYDKHRRFNRDRELRIKHACMPCYVSVTKLSEKVISRFDCEFCKISFPSEELRDTHVTDSHVFVESMICDKRLPTESWMRRHFRNDHSIGSDEYETCVCGKNMQEHEALEKHFFQHSMQNYTSAVRPSTVASECKPREMPKVCDSCGKSFWLDTCLEIHLRGCSKAIEDSLDPVTLQVFSRRSNDQWPNNSNELVCRVCWAQFSTQSALSNHVQFYATPMQCRCEVCGTNFNAQSLLEAHTRDTHTYDTAHHYSWFCTICDQGFEKKIYRRIHIAHVHGNKCPVTSSTKPTNDHQRAHANGSDFDDISRKCQICNLQFVSRKRFLEHCNYYKNGEEIICMICNQPFRGQHNAHRHYKLCHYPADIRQTYQHKCPMCKEAFAFKVHLKAHGKHVHGKSIHGINLMRKRSDVIRQNGKPDDSSAQSSMPEIARYHMCAVCEISFPNLDSLTAHQLDHEMDGKYVCLRCGKQCSTSTLLLDHLSLNHSTTISGSVKCGRCDEFFLSPIQWLSHIKHCHSSDVIQPPELYLEAHINFPNRVEVSEFRKLSANNRTSNMTSSDQASMRSNEMRSRSPLKRYRKKRNARSLSAGLPNKFFIRQTMFRCEVCPSAFDSEHLLELHRSGVHNITSKATQVNTLVVMTQLNGVHIVNPIPMGHLIPVPKEYLGQIVQAASNDDASKIISRSSDSDSPDPLKCEPCGFVFPTLKMLTLHNNLVHSESFPNIKCSDVGYRMNQIPSPSTINDATGHNPPLVDSLPIIRGPQTLGVNVDEQQSSIIMQSVSMSMPMTKPAMIMNGTDEPTSCIQDKQTKSSFVLPSFNTIMNDGDKSNGPGRNNCITEEREVVPKRIKQEPAD